ncbi:MAG: MYXO-CTERM sorting domain-containing protein [Pseudomonadota bacterium]|nr:MYXO-CTERM sorting domain-containing protein [Pseudomonadota bacterium]
MLLLLATLAWADSGDTAEPPDPCIELAFAPTACVSGETILVEVTDCGDGDWRNDEVTFAPSSDDGDIAAGTIGDDGVYRTAYVCPEVECPGARANLYVVVFDEAGRQDWAFGGVDVFCEENAEDLEAGPDGATCGCDAGAGGVTALLAMAGVLVGIGRRRRVG